MGVIPGLVVALGDERVEVLRAAVDALSSIGPPEANSAIPALLGILRERNPLRFPVVAPYMGWISRSEPGLEGELTDALSDKHPGIRAAAAEVLLRIEVTSTSLAVPALLAALNDHDEEVRFQAARAIAAIAPDASSAGIPILRSALEQGRDYSKTDDLWRRPWDRPENAIRALTRHGQDAADAVPALIDALDDFCIAEQAADALKCMGPHASAAVPALLRAFRSSEEEIRRAAAAALAAIGPDAASAAVTLLLGQLGEPDQFNRCCAADCLGIIGQPAANVAIPALQELMSDPSEYTRRSVALALEELGSPPAAGG